MQILAARHKKLERLQVWIFWIQPWRSTRDEGILFLSLLSGILSSDRACFLQQTLVTCLRILLSLLTPTDVFTLTHRDCFPVFSIFFLQLYHTSGASTSVFSIRVVVHYSHFQKQNHVWDKHFHLNFKSVDSS